MLEKVFIQNFQKHRKLIIDTNYPITTIIGESGKGKSSIIRSLVWLMTNKLPDSKWISWGKKRGSVCGVFEGFNVKRSKGTTENRYSLNKQNFDAVARSIPEEIQNVLKISDINIQQQHDSHFLLSCSAGECGRVLNDFAGISIIDTSLKNIQGDVNTDKNFLQSKLQELQELQEKRKLHIDAKKQKALIDSIEKKYRQIEVNKNRLNTGRRLLHNFKKLIDVQKNIHRKNRMLADIINTISEHNKKIERKSNIDILLSKQKSLIKKNMEYRKLIKLKRRIHRFDHLLSKKSNVSRYNKYDF